MTLPPALNVDGNHPLPKPVTLVPLVVPSPAPPPAVVGSGLLAEQGVEMPVVASSTMHGGAGRPWASFFHVGVT